MKRSIVLAAVLFLLAPPATARGQEAPRTDPLPGSPSEAVYGIPLEEARRDAAPGVVPGTTIRTENGVGSSARVPGEAEGRSDGDAEGRGERQQRQAARVAARVSGDPSPAATALLLVMLTGAAAGGGAAAGRLVGRRARL